MDRSSACTYRRTCCNKRAASTLPAQGYQVRVVSAAPLHRAALTCFDCKVTRKPHAQLREQGTTRLVL